MAAWQELWDCAAAQTSFAPDPLFLIRGRGGGFSAVCQPCRRDQPTGELLNLLSDSAAAETRISGLALTPPLWVRGTCQSTSTPLLGLNAGARNCCPARNLPGWKLLLCVLLIWWKVETKETHLHCEESSFLTDGQTDRQRNRQAGR